MTAIEILIDGRSGIKDVLAYTVERLAFNLPTTND
jgi:hypothetical protein